MDGHIKRLYVNGSAVKPARPDLQDQCCSLLKVSKYAGRLELRADSGHKMPGVNQRLGWCVLCDVSDYGLTMTVLKMFDAEKTRLGSIEK